MKSNNLTLVEQTRKDILKYISEHNDIEVLPKEQELVELLGVSRIVIREALSSLRTLGILETKRKKGSVITTPKVFDTFNIIISSGLLDRKALRDLYQLRLMLEIGMADFVFQNKTEQQMQALDSLVAREVELEEQLNKTEDEQASQEIAEELRNIDIAFHKALFEMTGNASLIDFQYILRHLFTLYRPRVKKDYHTHTIVSHVGLFNLLRNGTPDAFRMAMRLHLKRQFDTMEQILEKTIEK